MMVFYATTVIDLRACRELGRIVGPGYSTTPMMLAAHGLTDPGDEDATFTAQTYAAMAAVAASESTGRRVVVAIETAACDNADEWGSVQVDADWSAVRAIFIDDRGAGADLAAARSALGERNWTEAWETPAIQKLIDHDLLWYHPAELDVLEA